MWSSLGARRDRRSLSRSADFGSAGDASESAGGTPRVARRSQLAVVTLANHAVPQIIRGTSPCSRPGLSAPPRSLGVIAPSVARHAAATGRFAGVQANCREMLSKARRVVKSSTRAEVLARRRASRRRPPSRGPRRSSARGSPGTAAHPGLGRAARTDCGTSLRASGLRWGSPRRRPASPGPPGGCPRPSVSGPPLSPVSEAPPDASMLPNLTRSGSVAQMPPSYMPDPAESTAMAASSLAPSRDHSRSDISSGIRRPAAASQIQPRTSDSPLRYSNGPPWGVFCRRVSRKSYIVFGTIGWRRGGPTDRLLQDADL